MDLASSPFLAESPIRAPVLITVVLRAKPRRPRLNRPEGVEVEKSDSEAPFAAAAEPPRILDMHPRALATGRAVSCVELCPRISLTFRAGIVNAAGMTRDSCWLRDTLEARVDADAKASTVPRTADRAKR